MIKMSENSSKNLIKQAFELQNNGYYKRAIELLYKALSVEPENSEILCQIAELYFLLKNPQHAIEHYKKVIEAHPDNIDAQYAILNIYHKIGDFEQALIQAQKIYDRKPSAKALYELIFTLDIYEQYPQIIELYNNSGNKDSPNSNLYYLIAKAYQKTGDIQNAKSFYNLTLDEDNKNTSAMFALAQFLFDENNFNGAKSYLDRIITIKPDAQSYNLLGEIEIKKNNPTKACAYFSDAINLDAGKALYYSNIAKAHELNGWYDEAKVNFEKSLALEPKNIDYQIDLAYLYCENKEFKKAEQVLNYVVSVDPNNTYAMMLFALIYSQTDRIMQAQNILENLDKNIDNDFIYYVSARIYKQLCWWEKAIASLELALAIKPDSLEYLSELVENYLSLEDLDKAQTYALRIIGINKNYVFAHIKLAQIAYKQNRLSQALDYVENAISLDLNSSKGYFLKAQILLAQNKKDLAIEMVKKAIEYEPFNAEYYLFISKFYFAAQEYEIAMLYAKEAYTIEPSSAEYAHFCALCADISDDFIGARKYFSISKRLEPKNSTIACEFADLLEKNNCHADAIKMLKSTVKLVEAQDVKDILMSKIIAIKDDFYSRANFFQKISFFFICR